METTVEEDAEGRYVESGQFRYRSDELPPVGTYVTVDPYTGIDDNYYADIRWSADCPAGYSFTTARGWF